MRDVDLQVLIGELAEDSSSGAAELAGKAALVMMALAERDESVSSAWFQRQVASTGRDLIQAQPSMAPLFNLVNSMLWGLEGVQNLEEARRRVKDAARAFAGELASRGEKIALQTLKIVPEGATVLTHSRSSTVLRALLGAKTKGRKFQVVCTESRPRYEGRAVAEELSKAHIPTTVIIDAGVSEVIERVDVVVVGADSVSGRGLVNKMGTYGVALAARAQHVPFYSLCGTDKFLPAGYPFFEIREQDPDEVWPDHPRGVTVLNRYFDVTPLEYVSGLVTERGLLRQEEWQRTLGELTIHELLLEGRERGRNG